MSLEVRDFSHRKLWCSQHFFVGQSRGVPLNDACHPSCLAIFVHAHAGMYADLDFEALRNLDELLEGHSVVLAAMGSDLQTRETVPNAWMASVPRHPFWLFCIQQMIKRVAEDSRCIPR